MTLKKQITIGICTPYLTQDCQESRYSPGETAGHIISLKHIGYDRSSALSTHFAIVGNTIESEEFVSQLKSSGLIIARYSKFFGGRSSPYTGLGLTAEGAGYSLDIPKNPDHVLRLLSEDSFLEGILERDENKILDGLNQVSLNNRSYSESTRATPYLDEALKRGSPRVVSSDYPLNDNQPYESAMTRAKKRAAEDFRRLFFWRR